MRYVAAYMLCALGGNKAPSLADIEKVLGGVGIEVDQTRANKVISELNGKDLEQVMEKGMSQLASMPSGGAVVASGGAASAGAGPAAEKEEKKEEKKEESEDESDDDMGFGLFD